MVKITDDYEDFKLDNGLHVALQNTLTNTIAGRLTINQGTVHEGPGEEGLAHYLEHCLAHGSTRKYSVDKMRMKEFMFGAFNATTSHDRTTFYGDVLAEDFESFLEFVSSMTVEPGFDQKTIEEERQRILREISDERSNPKYSDMRDLRGAMLGEDHPLLKEILGEGGVIRSAMGRDLRAIHKRGYVGGNMGLILVGGIPKNCAQLVQKYFKDVPTGHNGRFEFPYIESMKERSVLHSAAPDLLIRTAPKESNSMIYLGIVVPPRSHEDWATLVTLGNIIGTGTSSRLYKSISQEKGLAYQIGGSYNGDNNIGKIVISGSVIAERQEEVIDLIFEEFKKLREVSVRWDELEIKKKGGRYKIAKLFEGNDDRLNAIDYMIRDGKTPESLLSDLEAVTPDKILEISRKYLPGSRDDNRYALLIRDPLKKD